MDIKLYLSDRRKLVDSYLKSYFTSPVKPLILHKAIKYSLLSPGKRIRPILALASYEACGGNAAGILPQAAALELIHAYSLIHDDLPAMDNDDLRRGKPTNHKVFGEAIAILAGDALLTEAFLMMTYPHDYEPSNLKASSLLRVVREVASAAGYKGMVGGQAQDIISENTRPDRATVEFIHTHKTAALLKAAVRVGPLLARAKERQLDALTRYGEYIGLAFQIIDDILDVEGTTEELGKSAGSDSRKKKMTFPSLYGTDGARKKANELLSKAGDALRLFSSEADPLREIAEYLGQRRA